ncbi:regulator of chromosome condensation, partial [Orpheovirus IHUMI-LCC2]
LRWKGVSTIKKILQIPNAKGRYISAGCGYIIFIGMNNKVYMAGQIFGDNDKDVYDGHANIDENNVLYIWENINYYLNTYDNDTKLYSKYNNYKLLFDGYAKSISAGANHLAIIDKDDNVWIYGEDSFIDTIINTFGINNREGLIKLPNMKAKKISCGYEHMGIIDYDDNVILVGSNNHGQLGIDDENIVINKINGYKVKNINCGWDYTAFIDDNNNLYTFGYNGYVEGAFVGEYDIPSDGRLGLGETKYDICLPTIVPNIKAKDVNCGTNNTLIIDKMNRMYITGDYNVDIYTPCLLYDESDIKVRKCCSKDITISFIDDDYILYYNRKCSEVISQDDMIYEDVMIDWNVMSLSVGYCNKFIFYIKC